MNPTDGTLYPEEREVYDWLNNESEYTFADFSREADYSWVRWRKWVVPTAYLYEDYWRWKMLHLYNDYDPDAPHVLRSRQFGAVLRWLIPSINPREEQGGWKRKTIIQRVCTRTGRRKNLRVIRGIKHPDAYYIDDTPGPRPRDYVTPLPT